MYSSHYYLVYIADYLARLAEKGLKKLISRQSHEDLLKPFGVESSVVSYSIKFIGLTVPVSNTHTSISITTTHLLFL